MLPEELPLPEVFAREGPPGKRVLKTVVEVEGAPSSEGGGTALSKTRRHMSKTCWLMEGGISLKKEKKNKKKTDENRGGGPKRKKEEANDKLTLLYCVRSSSKHFPFMYSFIKYVSQALSS